MARNSQPLTGVERTFPEDEIIVSKTDCAGRITYANDVFMEVAGYSERELLGQPHSVIRHPRMPRCVFRLLWQRIEAGEEIFAYVNNRAKNGDHYWVFAHVTPNLNASGAIIGYHSSRRLPRRDAIATIAPIYDRLLEVEQRQANRKDGLAAGSRMLESFLGEKGISYDRFVLGL